MVLQNIYYYNTIKFLYPIYTKMLLKKFVNPWSKKFLLNQGFKKFCNQGSKKVPQSRGSKSFLTQGPRKSLTQEFSLPKKQKVHESSVKEVSQLRIKQVLQARIKRLP